MSDQEAIWKWRLNARIRDLEDVLRDIHDGCITPQGNQSERISWVLHDQGWIYRDPNEHSERYMMKAWKV